MRKKGKENITEKESNKRENREIWRISEYNLERVQMLFLYSLFTLLLLYIMLYIMRADVIPYNVNSSLGMFVYFLLKKIMPFGIIILYFSVLFWELFRMVKRYLDFYSEQHSNRSNSEYREYLVKKLKKDVDEEVTIINNNSISSDVHSTIAEDNRKEEKRDILALMLKNNDETTEYFTISKKHAKSSYRFSVIASVVGMIMLGIAIYGVVVVNNIDLTIIGVVSGAVTEIVAGLVLWIHNKSAMQLNYYYDALHENEKFLAAINITDKLSDEKREEMYIEIIRKQIEIHNTERNKD